MSEGRTVEEKDRIFNLNHIKKRNQPSNLFLKVSFLSAWPCTVMVRPPNGLGRVRELHRNFTRPDGASRHDLWSHLPPTRPRGDRMQFAG